MALLTFPRRRDVIYGRPLSYQKLQTYESHRKNNDEKSPRVIKIKIKAIQIIRDTFLAYFRPPPPTPPWPHVPFGDTFSTPPPRCDVTIFNLQKT